MSRDSQGQAAQSPRHGGQSRRGFMGFASLIIGAIVSLAPFCIGLFAFLDPLFAKGKIPLSRRKTAGSAKEGYIRVAALSALTVGDVPQRFAVIADWQDAWNYITDQPIGAVFIQRTTTNVLVFNATCPHAGCSVACDGRAFVCPCHNSTFNLDGTKRVSDSGRENPSPRDLDSLDVDRDQLEKGEIWVKFINFYTGKEEPIPKL